MHGESNPSDSTAQSLSSSAPVPRCLPVWPSTSPPPAACLQASRATGSAACLSGLPPGRHVAAAGCLLTGITGCRSVHPSNHSPINHPLPTNCTACVLVAMKQRWTDARIGRRRQPTAGASFSPRLTTRGRPRRTALAVRPSRRPRAGHLCRARVVIVAAVTRRPPLLGDAGREKTPRR